jgi:glycosyltransferase involved in cell wall biosynthesis
MYPMRIVQIIPGLGVGGLERIATNLSIGLHRTGRRVVVCSHDVERHMTTLQDELAAAGVDVVSIPRPRPSPRAVLRSSLAIARVLRREQPDILHAHNPAAAVAAAGARWLARARSTAIVATFHGLADGDPRRAVRPLKLADIVVGIGPYASKELVDVGFPPDRLLTVANAVEAKPTRSPQDVRAEFGVDSAELIVNVGRLVPEKNQQLMLDALAQLVPRRPRLRALIVGRGPLQGELEARIDELDLRNVVQLTGPRADAVDVIAAADLLVSTSSREGLGLTLLEALAVETPVVATAVGGAVDVLAGGEAGILVPSGDADALAAAIERGLDDTDLRARMIARGREHAAADFSAEAMLEGYLAAYTTALSRRRRSP